jgi:hypothetical protein
MKKILYTFLTLILFNGLVQAQFKTDFVFGFNRTAIVNATYEDRIDMAEPPAPKRSNKKHFNCIWFTLFKKWLSIQRKFFWHIL